MNRLAYTLVVVPALFGAACGGSSSTGNDLAHVATADLSTAITTDAAVPAPDLAVIVQGDMAHGPVDMAASPPDLAPPPPTPPQVVESCNASDYIDMTAATAVIAVAPWSTSLGKKCLRVKAGAQVSWAASMNHPLEATTGTTPSPLPAAPGTQATTTLTFSTAGVYGYQCHVHTSMMHGAIWVVP